jgi:hypothetical protein
LITFTGILVLMLAYAALSLGVICLFWYLSRNDIEQRWQRRAVRKGVNRRPDPAGRYHTSRNERMVDSLSTFGRATVLAVVVAAAVAVLAYQPALGTGSIALSTGSSVPVPKSPSHRQDDGRPVNHLATFLERWTSTAEPSGNKK